MRIVIKNLTYDKLVSHLKKLGPKEIGQVESFSENFIVSALELSKALNNLLMETK